MFRWLIDFIKRDFYPITRLPGMREEEAQAVIDEVFFSHKKIEPPPQHIWVCGQITPAGEKYFDAMRRNHDNLEHVYRAVTQCTPPLHENVHGMRDLYVMMVTLMRWGMQERMNKNEFRTALRLLSK